MSRVMAGILFCIAIASYLPAARADFNILPTPQHVTHGHGAFELRDSDVIAAPADARAQWIAGFLRDALHEQTGVDLQVVPAPERGRISLRIDSSIARYKFGANHRSGADVPGLVRVPASVTSSVLRIPAVLRDPWLAALTAPAILFVHPWEAADFRRSALRWDCRFRTGAAALAAWRVALSRMQESGARFARLDALVAAA